MDKYLSKTMILNYINVHLYQRHIIISQVHHVTHEVKFRLGKTNM